MGGDFLSFFFVFDVPSGTWEEGWSDAWGGGKEARTSIIDMCTTAAAPHPNVFYVNLRGDDSFPRPSFYYVGCFFFWGLCGDSRVLVVLCDG